jgi:hypothetical protein
MPTPLATWSAHNFLDRVKVTQRRGLDQGEPAVVVTGPLPLPA